MLRIGRVLFPTLLCFGLAASAYAAPARPGAAPQATPVKEGQPKAPLIDLNSASEEELKALPGIGDAYAKKIVEGRPYANKQQLVAKKIIPQKVFAAIKDRVIAKQDGAAKDGKR